VRARTSPGLRYLVRSGPSTQQERWEEAAGYSPATIAAEIAALDAAVEWSRKKAKSTDRAPAWAAVAATLGRGARGSTFTRTGGLGSGYYLRISADGHPERGRPHQHRQQRRCVGPAEIVDPSFLELGGLECARRWTLRDGDDQSRRRPPASAQAARDDGWGTATRTTAMERKTKARRRPERDTSGRSSAGSGGLHRPRRRRRSTVRRRPGVAGRADQLLGEQVWEGTGLPTGSARPLVWAHAEYIVLAARGCDRVRQRLTGQLAG